MAYLPTGWTNRIAEGGDFSVVVTLTIGKGDETYIVPDDYLVKVEWIYETDISGRLTPLDEMDVTLSNVSGIFDIDNPESLSDKLRQNNYLHAEMVFTKDGVDYVFPMGDWLISERSYNDDNVVLVCYDTSLPLTSARDVLECNWDMYGLYIDDLKDYMIAAGVSIKEFVKSTTFTPHTELWGNRKASYGVGVNMKFTDRKISSLTGTYCFTGGSIVDDTSVPGLTFRFKGSSIMSLYFSGTPRQAGYYYIPIFNIANPPTFYGYLEFSVEGYSDSTSAGTQILATFLKKDDDPSYVSENPSVTDQMHILMKTLFEPYLFKNTRDGGYEFRIFDPDKTVRFAGQFDERVLEYPHPVSKEEDAINTLTVDYFQLESEETAGIHSKEYQNMQLSDVSILQETIHLPQRQLSLSDRNDTLEGTFWADRIADQFWTSGIRYPTFIFSLIGSPEIEPKDLIYVKGKYDINPYYVKKVTMTYDGYLTSEVEGLLLDRYRWDYVDGSIWQTYKDTKTWGQVLAIQKDFK